METKKHPKKEMEIPWTSEEETLLIILYRYMNVNELTEHINRSALAIAFRVVKLGLETNINNVRGFEKKWLRGRKQKPTQKIFSVSKVTVFFK